MISRTSRTRARLGSCVAFGAVVVLLLSAASAANAQGLVQGVQQGAQAGNKAAGPVGGVLGGAIGGVVRLFPRGLEGLERGERPTGRADKKRRSPANAPKHHSGPGGQMKTRALRRA